MNPECGPFRAALERALSGPRAAFLELARDPHLDACASCRAELVREERLEAALARVTAPEAPRGLAQRLLAGLASARDAAAVSSAENAGVADELTDDIDELLARVPVPRPPPQLAEDVLARLAPARRAPRLRRWGLIAAAAAVLAVSFLWLRSGASRPADQSASSGATELEPDEELLTYALENWDLLQDDDLDVWLASLDPVDEFLMRVDDDPSWLDEPATDAKPGAKEGD